MDSRGDRERGRGDGGRGDSRGGREDSGKLKGRAVAVSQQQQTSEGKLRDRWTPGDRR